MCIFCEIRDGKLSGLKINTDFDCFILMDKFPVSPGHLLLVSEHHGEFLTDVTTSVQNNMMTLVSQLTQSMRESDHKILGFNIVINDGKYAGQHIPHLHIHLIPRYRFDRFPLMFRFLTSRLNPKNYFVESRSKLSFFQKVELVMASITPEGVTKCN